VSGRGEGEQVILFSGRRFDSGGGESLFRDACGRGFGSDGGGSTAARAAGGG